LHESIYDEFLKRLTKAYSSIKIGDPLEKGVLCGPLHTKSAVEQYKRGIEQAKKEGGKVAFGGNVVSGKPGNFVEPTIIEISPNAPITQNEVSITELTS